MDFVYGVDFSDTVFLHALLLVEDYIAESDLVGFGIYIGNNYDWSQNQKCAGGPFGSAGKGGAEIWCNKEGQFLHIVKQNIPAGVISYSICSLGAFGTKYIRSIEFDVSDTIKII